MRRETKLVLVFLAVVCVSVGGIMSFALPTLRPITLPHLSRVEITVGPQRHVRTLDAEQTATLDRWLQAHRHGWGPLGSSPPSSGDSILTLWPQGPGAPIHMALYTGISPGDWDNIATIDYGHGQVLRLRAFSKHEFTPLRQVTEPVPFARSNFP